MNLKRKEAYGKLHKLCYHNSDQVQFFKLFLKMSKILNNISQRENWELSCSLYVMVAWDLLLLIIWSLWMRFSRMVWVSDCQCQRPNNPGFNPRILRYSGNWGTADETALTFAFTAYSSQSITFIRKILKLSGPLWWAAYINGSPPPPVGGVFRPQW